MMSVTIDPSETRRPVTPTLSPAPGRLRLVLLSGLGVLGLAGFTALASSMLGSLAGPQFARASIRTAAVTQKASEWPDLRDGVPALAPATPVTAPDKPAPLAAAPAAPDVEVVTPAAIQPAPVPTPMPAAITTAPPAQKPRVETVAAAKSARLPPIENAMVLPPARPASLVPVARTAALVAPSPAETTRSRATNGTFTALPPEREAPKHKAAAIPAQAKSVAAKPVAAKPAPAKVAAAAPPQVAEAEPEQTEVFGLKVPSLAPAGRKLAEGVEALGKAVRSLPDHF
jgi:hypothetical protein